MKGKINLQKAYSSSNKSKTLSRLLSLLLDLLVTAIEDSNLGGVIYGDGDDKEQDYVLIAVYYACLIVSKGKPQLFQGDVVEFLERISCDEHFDEPPHKKINLGVDFPSLKPRLQELIEKCEKDFVVLETESFNE